MRARSHPHAGAGHPTSTPASKCESALGSASAAAALGSASAAPGSRSHKPERAIASRYEAMHDLAYRIVRRAGTVVV